MSIAETFLPEFDHEIASTRKILERVPDDRLAWRPHPKSMTLGRLASHLAELPELGAITFEHDTLDFAPKTGTPVWTSKELDSRDSIVANFDRAASRARAALASARDESLREMWTLRAGDHVIVQLPRIASYRNMMMNHLIHHRGQLSVYLRLCDVPVPGMYGPSNDER
jgi:uncharacterized damage-inducible protein DinB